MTQPAKAQEPTMEEILASIRRIIADEETTKPAARAAAAEPPAMKSAPAPEPPPVPEPPEENEFDDAPVAQQRTAEPADDPLAETEARAAPEPASVLQDFDAEPDAEVDEPAEPPLSAPRPAGAQLRALESPLLSAEATAAVNSAFGTLAHTVLVQNATTLEDLVKEMLRPLLKTWLDDNLPNLVERLVRAEIERVSRGHPG
jgi:uncharacterized protein